MTRTFSTHLSSTALAVLGLVVLGGCERDKRYVHVVFERFDLAADRAGLSEVTDPQLVNPMGLQVSPGNNFWVANNATGTVTVYQRDGTPLPASAPLVVKLPVPATLAAGTLAQATGIAYHGGYGLEIASGDQRASARFLVTTREGTLLGYNPDLDRESAVIAVDNSPSGAVYRGLSVVAFRSGSRVYATNFHSGKVDVFDENFAPATDLDPAAFEDLELPAGYAPFGIQRINGRLYVSYAEQDADGRDPVTGPGKGYIDAFALDGQFLGRIASEGELDAPWGMALAPWSMPFYSGALFVGNVGDGRIHAFDLWNLSSLGSLNDTFDQPLVIDGLGDLTFGYGLDGYLELYFAAGPNGGANGAFGTLLPRIIDVDPPPSE
jgi:uncharacterized protein (TIGR03118 family)